MDILHTFVKFIYSHNLTKEQLEDYDYIESLYNNFKENYYEKPKNKN